MVFAHYKKERVSYQAPPPLANTAQTYHPLHCSSSLLSKEEFAKWRVQVQKRARLLIESLSYQQIEKATEQLDEEHRPSKLDMECYIARFLGVVDIDWDARWVMSLLIQTKWDYEAAVQRYHNNSFPIEMLKDIADKRMLEPTNAAESSSHSQQFATSFW